MIEVKSYQSKWVVGLSQWDLEGDIRMNQAKLGGMGKIGANVVSDQGLTLAQDVGRLLAALGQTPSVVESCTGGSEEKSVGTV